MDIGRGKVDVNILGMTVRTEQELIVEMVHKMVIGTMRQVTIDGTATVIC